MSEEKAARKSGSEEIAAISALVDPWLYIGGTWRPFPGFAGDPAAGPYRFETIVSPPGGAGAQASGAAMRAALLASAEAALAALADAGWQLTSYPDMTFSGHVKPFTQSLDGKVVLPSRQYGITLRLDFAVDRAR